MSATSVLTWVNALAALGVGLPAVLLGSGTPVAAAETSQITAIDILLEPDQVMLQHAEADNAHLLKIFPKGFTLDATHRPHVTIVQRFVRTDSLDKVYLAAEKVFASAQITKMKLEAYKYYYTPGKDVGVAGIAIRPTQELLKLQQDMIAAVTPFTVETGRIDAFTAPQDNAADDALLIGYVATFIPKQVGNDYKPHVSIGVATLGYLDKMVTEPFEAFSFSPAGGAVYHLGPYGTAAKKLAEWK